MNNEIKNIQQTLIHNLERLDSVDDNIEQEIARSNAIAQLANTYIKSCNLIIRVEETKINIEQKIKEVR